MRISWRGNPPGKAEPILGTQDDKVGIFLLPSFPLVQNTHSELANISQRHTAESDIRYQIFFRDFPRRLTLCCRPAWGARRFGPDRGIWCAARPYWAGRQRSDIKGYGLNASYGMAFDQDTEEKPRNEKIWLKSFACWDWGCTSQRLLFPLLLPAALRSIMRLWTWD